MQKKIDHLLIDILAISVMAIIAGADGPEAIEEWAKSNHIYLKQYLELPHGIHRTTPFNEFWKK